MSSTSTAAPKIDRFGLVILAEPPSDICNVDIVAIHSLRGDQLRSWTHQNGVLWLRDLLPYDIPTARILSFGYNSEILSPSRHSTQNVAQELLYCIANFRDSELKNRPLIFVCNGLGGLILKSARAMALHRSWAFPELAPGEIVQQTRGIIFLATPHRGTDVASVANSLTSVLSIFKSSGGKSFLKIMMKDSEEASMLRESFLIYSKKFEITSFCESIATKHSGGLIVTPDSAFLELPNERRLHLNATNLEMCRYSGTNDVNFRRVSSEIGRMVSYATAPEENIATRPESPSSIFNTTKATDKLTTDSFEAENWFKSLLMDVHLVALERYKDGRNRVRVAIIDTGIDGSHPLLKEFQENGQIRCKSWIPDRPADKDEDGHGTHVAHSFLKVAPKAEIYVAKVFRTGAQKELVDNRGLIAKAIDYAALGWKVDIISISWGYSEEVVEIKAAIRNAFHRGVIIFAAGGNSGANPRNPILFPASLRQVICISSTDAFNKPSKFNPPAMADRTLSILGEAVTAAWPSNDGVGTTSVQSGSSIATPIAVGVAALILEYVRQPGKETEKVADQKRLNHSDQMRKVLHAMANVKEGFHCITPAKLFDEKSDQRHVRICSAISGILDSL